MMIIPQQPNVTSASNFGFIDAIGLEYSVKILYG